MFIKYIYYPPAGTAFTGISSDENYEKTFEFLTFVSMSNMRTRFSTRICIL